MASSRFNPYRNWLGLDGSPDNYYALFGLPLWESDQERIRAASTRALSNLRSVKPGRRQQRWQDLLDQLQTARDCLLSAGDKARYDGRLHRRLEGADAANEPETVRLRRHPPEPSGPPPDPMAPVELENFARLATRQDPKTTGTTTPPQMREDATQTPPPTEDESGESAGKVVKSEGSSGRGRLVRSRDRRRRAYRSRLTTAAYLFTAICFLGLLSVFVAVMQLRILPSRDDRSRRQAAIPHAAKDLPLTLDPRAVISNERGDTAALPIDSSTSAEPAEASPHDPTELPGQLSRDPLAESETIPLASIETTEKVRKEHIRLLRASVDAMTERRWSDAEQLLDRAGQLDNTIGPAKRVERFATLTDYAKRYWQAFADALPGLQGSEIDWNGSLALVVESNRDGILLRILGKNKRYSIHEFPMQTMMAITDRQARSTPMLRGAFMLVTPESSLSEAREVLRNARRSGADVGDLITIFNDFELLNIKND